ncbi:DNA-(apurinic or apyrimidinic site) endonuclease 2 [Neosynchiropus ocellatus]
MRLVTWNINGIRTFGGGIKKALDSLGADIICVQETKVTRDLLTERTAIVDGYTSYFSFSRGRSGYSGVATYCKNTATPFAAEEGLTGLLSNQNGAVECYGDQSHFTNEELQLLDNEGRAVITQHRIKCGDQTRALTVINVYCPRADPDKPERKQFKLNFYKLLQLRAEALLRGGSSVIILGDVNTSHRQIDHCDPSDADNFEDNPGRRWLDSFLTSREESDEAPGKFIDTFRLFHPTRTGAFTCWSTLTGARQTNYGTRIDYILADRRLAKQEFVAADIMPEVEGSDHCPVWGELSGALLSSSKPPPLATCYLPEFAGKQQKLSRFLVRVEPRSSPKQEEALPGSQDEEEQRENLKACGAGTEGRKRLLQADPAQSKAKKTKTPASSKPKGSLLSFFKPKLTNAALPNRDASIVTSSSVAEGDSSGAETDVSSKRAEDSSEESKLKTEATGHSLAKKGASPDFWKSVLRGPPPPPCCKVHGEPCVLRTVKKEGPNLGKQFFVCARPQGHSSNPEARCNYFAWVEKGRS